jgi:hypothetical protein
MSDLPRFWRAVYSVVRYVDPDPDNAHGIVWTRCDLRLGICGISVPEQVGVVVVSWISHHRSDHPIGDGERVVCAAARHRGVKDDLAFPAISNEPDKSNRKGLSLELALAPHLLGCCLFYVPTVWKKGEKSDDPN